MNTQEEHSQPGKTEKSWAKQHNSLFSIANFIHKYYIFKISKHTPRWILTFYGHLFGKLMIRNRKYLYKVRKSIKALFPTISNPKINKLMEGHKAYMGSLMVDAMVYSPNINYTTAKKFITFQNIELLDAELAKKKGVIIVSGHIGWFFHVIAGLVYHPNRYNVQTLVQPANIKLYEHIVNRPEIRNILKLIPADRYKQYKPKVISHLKNNGIFIILQDYSKLSHSKVPFWKGKIDKQITTPNSAANLAHETSASILVAIPHPDGTIGKTKYEFIDSSDINQIIQQTNGSPEAHLYYEINSLINQKLAPYFIRYLHVWEELPNLNYRLEE